MVDVGFLGGPLAAVVNMPRSGGKQQLSEPRSTPSSLNLSNSLCSKADRRRSLPLVWVWSRRQLLKLMQTRDFYPHQMSLPAASPRPAPAQSEQQPAPGRAGSHISSECASPECACWRARAKITSGAVFRGIDCWGTLESTALSPQ